MGFDPVDLEQELCRMPEVLAARVVVDGPGRPSEVRLLASPERSAKRLRRDVQSVASASFGIELEPQAITVTQLERAASPSTPPGLREVSSLASVFDPPGGGPGDAEGRPAEDRGTTASPSGQEIRAGGEVRARPTLSSVSASTDGRGLSVEVTVEAGGGRRAAAAQSSISGGAAARATCRAALSALAEADPAVAGTWIESVTTVETGGRALVLVCVLAKDDDPATGSAPVGPAGVHHAVASAVLDALYGRRGA